MLYIQKKQWIWDILKRKVTDATHRIAQVLEDLMNEPTDCLGRLFVCSGAHVEPLK